MKRKTLKEKFKNWPVKIKLKYSFGFIILTTFLLIAALLVAMKVIEKSLVKLYEGPTRNINYSAELYYPQLDIQRAVNRVLVEGVDKKDESYKQLEDTVNKNLAIMNDSYSFLSGNLITKVDRDRLEAINNRLNNEVSKYRTEVMRLLKAGDFEGAKEYNNKYYMPAVNETKAMIEEFEVSVMETAVDYKNEAAFIGNLFIIIGAILLVLITLGAVSAARVVTSAIMDPVKQIEAATKGLRSGELSHGNEITYESEDELGVLAKSIRESMNILDGYVKEICDNFEMVASGDLTKNLDDITDFLGDFERIKKSFVVILREFNLTLNQIKDVSGQVDADSDDVAAASNDLATGTSEQASAVEELTATIETVSSMAEEAAKEAQNTYEMMMSSVEKAQDEKEQMQELQEEMHRIKEISSEIEVIVTSIEEIASQTSLLALNASIEAARAGDAGKGFAVVADQIGKLATDSANAVLNTKELISKTVEEINKGDKVTEDTAVGFERIIQELENFAEQSNKNKEVSKAQSAALLQISDGINQISVVTTQNAASSEECSAISEELAARAQELDTLVNKFKLHAN